VTAFQINTNTSSNQRQLSPEYRPTLNTEMRPTTFKPIKLRKGLAGGKMKTHSNRANYCSKRGLEVSNHRDDNAFRTAKSRLLKQLRQSECWDKLDNVERQAKENKAVAELEAKRDAKKRAHELEWLQKVEKGDVDDDELSANESSALLDEEDEWNGIDDPEWTGIQSEESMEYNESSSIDPAALETFEAIREKSKLGWIQKMRKLKAVAQKRAKEWDSMIGG
jgi:hypothetical protein